MSMADMTDVARFETMNLIDLPTGSLLDIQLKDPQGSYDRFHVLSSSEQPYVQIIELCGLTVIGEPVQILGSCSKEAFQDRLINKFPEDFVLGSIISGMRYLMRGSRYELFLSTNNVAGAINAGSKRLSWAQREFVPKFTRAI